MLRARRPTRSAWKRSAFSENWRLWWPWHGWLGGGAGTVDGGSADGMAGRDAAGDTGDGDGGPAKVTSVRHLNVSSSRLLARLLAS